MTTCKELNILTHIAYLLNESPQNNKVQGDFNFNDRRYDYSFENMGWDEWNVCRNCNDDFIGWGLYVIKETHFPERGIYYCQRCVMQYQGEIRRTDTLFNLNHQ